METLQAGSVTTALAELTTAATAYLDFVGDRGVARVSDAEVLAELRELETLRRRLAVADHALIAEIDRRGLVGRLTLPSASALLQGVLRLSPYEAGKRVEAAKACGPRAALTGEPLPPLRPQLAAAQAAGQVSLEHTKVILAALAELPATLSAEGHALAEKHLVEAAITLRPREAPRRNHRTSRQ